MPARPLRESAGAGAARPLALALGALSFLALIPTDGAEAQERPGPSSATALVGSVVDADSGDPLEGVEVRLPQLGLSATTNAEGEFRFLEVEPGPLVLQFRRGETVSRTMSARIPAGTTTSLTVRVETTPVPVDSLVVQVRGRRYSGKLAGFYQREARSSGLFLDRADLERSGTGKLASVLKQQPGVRTKRCVAGEGAGTDRGRRRGGALGLPGESGSDAPGAEPRGGRPESPTTGRGTGTPDARRIQAPRPERRYVPGCQKVWIRRNCSPRFYFDGAPLPKDDPAIARNLSGLDVASLEAVEIYRSAAEIPAAYRTRDACAVVLLWSRQGAG